MGHDHGHAYEGAHDHAPKNYGRAFIVGIALNMIFVAVEAAYGISAHSVALVADAAHNLSDVLGLALAWGAFLLAQRKPSRRRTYGLRKTTILAALANSVLLLLAIGAVLALTAFGTFLCHVCSAILRNSGRQNGRLRRAP